jgi:hypothetical protein
MEKDKLIEIVNDAENKSNKDLDNAEIFLFDEHEKAKALIIDLTRHMESIEEMHAKVTKEINKRRIV